ncbi:hypothetical protein [Mesorhizobium sp. STM 4661]|uniref:hypothetical protein n=1 Tax=Mesorhizobium sp. STM 4661 TaxID=1297570 RepID=UPI0002BE3DC1|nr:hypothetical protein [Mesorhizobium sp. STM 4661]CCV15911.1 hypothetical protein MESS4_830131 [Mesorhizobium sp. STM 4661]
MALALQLGELDAAAGLGGVEAVEQVGERNIHAVHGVGAGMPEIADDGKTASDDKVYRLNLMLQSACSP